MFNNQQITSAVSLLEEELKSHSELACTLDSISNYDLSVTHHETCINIIKTIQNIKSQMKGEYTFDYRRSTLFA